MSTNVHDRSNILSQVAIKHDLNGIKDKIKRATESTKLQIAFIGSFNAGKSSLLNAIVGKEILPHLMKPTTAKQVFLEPSNSNTDFKYFESNEGISTEISLSDFQLKCTSSNPGGQLSCTFPCKEQWMETLLFIDHPGLESANSEHDDLLDLILDEADLYVLVLDSTTGSLADDALKVIFGQISPKKLENILVVLTRAKNSSDPEIKAKIETISSQIEGKINEIQRGKFNKRFACVDSLSANNKINRQGTLEFIDLVQKVLEEEKPKIKTDASNSLIDKIKRDLILHLEYKLSIHKFDSAALETERMRIKLELENLVKQIELIKVEFSELEGRIYSQIKIKIAELFSEIRQIGISDSPEDRKMKIDSKISEYSIKIKETIKNEINSTNLLNQLKSEDITDLGRTSDIASTIESTIIFTIETIEWLIVAAAAAISAGGTAVATAGVKTAKEVGKKIAENEIKNQAKKNIFKKVFQFVAKNFPTEVLKDATYKLYMNIKHEDLVDDVSKGASSKIIASLNKSFERLYLHPQNSKLSDQKKILSNYEAEIEQAEYDSNKGRESIVADISMIEKV
jgi:GTPase SAR1 family protein